MCVDIARSECFSFLTKFKDLKYKKQKTMKNKKRFCNVNETSLDNLICLKTLNTKKQKTKNKQNKKSLCNVNETSLNNLICPKLCPVILHLVKVFLLIFLHK